MTLSFYSHKRYLNIELHLICTKKLNKMCLFDPDSWHQKVCSYLCGTTSIFVCFYLSLTHFLYTVGSSFSQQKRFSYLFTIVRDCSAYFAWDIKSQIAEEGHICFVCIKIPNGFAIKFPSCCKRNDGLQKMDQNGSCISKMTCLVFNL